MIQARWTPTAGATGRPSGRGPEQWSSAEYPEPIDRQPVAEMPLCARILPCPRDRTGSPSWPSRRWSGSTRSIPSCVLGDARDEAGNPLYDVRLCSVDGGPVAATTGYGLVPHGDAVALARADTADRAGHPVCPARAPTARSPPTSWPRSHSVPPSARTVSRSAPARSCSPRPGLLDGRPATTHWAHAARFRELYPRVQLDENVLFVDDGDVLTSAGLAAGVDLCLHLIRRDHGTAVANRVARHCVVPPWRDGRPGAVHRPDPRRRPPTSRRRPRASGRWRTSTPRLDVAAAGARRHA